MTSPIPAWLMKRYAKLWIKKHEKAFTFPEARKALEISDPRTLTVILSELKLKGWLNVERDPKDARKKLYSLNPPEEIVEEIAER